MSLVTTNLYGRLGNQLMQMANVIAYSNKYGVPYCIPKDTANNLVWKPYHFENINYCDIDYRNKQTCIYRESSHAYTEIPKIDCNGVTLLEGYFQSELYFKDYLPEVRKAFGFDKKDYKYALYGEGNEKSRLENVCAIHVRRGDYLMYPDKHPVVNEEYLIKALSIMEENKVTNFCFFSDDIEWCKNFISTLPQLARLGKDLYFVYSENQAELMDFELMMNCKNFIISNSTFSLMAAILSESPNKVVISPSAENWFGEGNKNLSTETIIPKSFIKIKY